MQSLKQVTMSEPRENDFRTIYYSPEMIRALAENCGFAVRDINQLNPRDGYLYVSLTK